MADFNKDKIDLAKLQRLANHVYPSGGQEIKKLVDDILAGRPLQV